MMMVMAWAATFFNYYDDDGHDGDHDGDDADDACASNIHDECDCVPDIKCWIAYKEIPVNDPGNML